MIKTVRISPTFPLRMGFASSCEPKLILIFHIVSIRTLNELKRKSKVYYQIARTTREIIVINTNIKLDNILCKCYIYNKCYKKEVIGWQLFI
jgi:hypothetical protein